MNPKEYIDERYPLSELTGRIIAAARVVHQELGPGFEEVIYQRALGYELPAHGVEFEREVWIDVLYRGKSVGKKRVDFVVGDHSGSALIEIKAKAKLDWEQTIGSETPGELGFLEILRVFSVLSFSQCLQ